MISIQSRDIRRTTQRHCHEANRPIVLHRRGAALAAAMIAFAVTTAILFTVLRSIVSHQQQLFAGAQSLQAASLAEAGMHRAVAKLQKNAEYRGEGWKIPADELDGMNAGTVDIKVEPIIDQTDQMHVIVRADFPSDTEHRVRRSLESVIQMAQGTN